MLDWVSVWSRRIPLDCYDCDAKKSLFDVGFNQWTSGEHYIFYCGKNSMHDYNFIGYFRVVSREILYILGKCLHIIHILFLIVNHYCIDLDNYSSLL